MDFTNDEKFVQKVRSIAPATKQDIEQLKELLKGLSISTELMESLIQPFGREIDFSKMSSDVDGKNNG
tara:strand:- start:562 stop:765 length:204 start_codon:yes stop_codon:yes gene_type:complete